LTQTIRVAAVLLALGAWGCARRTGASATGDADRRTLRLAQTAEPTTFDPALVQDGPTIEVLMHLYDGLVQWTTENKLAPAIAERWEVGENGRLYTFHLRPDVKFSNGRTVTAADFVYGMTRALLPAARSSVAMTYLNDIVGARAVADGKATTLDGVTAVDDHTLRIKIDAPKAYFLSKLTYPTAYAVCREAIEGNGGQIDERNVVGTGPFRLGEYRRGEHLLLVANDTYFEGRPKLDQIDRLIVLDAGTRHQMYEAGQLDIVDVSTADLEQDQRDARLSKELRKFDRPAVFYCAMNQTAFPPFRDRRVRQAFNEAIDRRRLIQTVLMGVNQPAEGIVPPGVPGYDAAFKGLDFDPAQARRLLGEAGYPDGKGFPALTLTFRERVPDIKRSAEVVAEMLRTNLGVTVTLHELEWGKFLAERNRGSMPFYFLRWMADYLDPQNFLSVMLHSGAPENTIGYHNPTFDRLCDQADTMQDPQRRLALYHQAETLVVQDAAWVPIYFQKDVELWNPRLQGVEDMLLGHLPHKRTTLASLALQAPGSRRQASGSTAGQAASRLALHRARHLAPGAWRLALGARY
jgi:oligopeptide transport system substrate-binding protein